MIVEMRNSNRLYPMQLIIAASNLDIVWHRQHFIPQNDPRTLNPTILFFQQTDFQQNILVPNILDILLHVPINEYNHYAKMYQNLPTISTVPVAKNHEPLKKRRSNLKTEG